MPHKQAINSKEEPLLERPQYPNDPYPTDPSLAHQLKTSRETIAKFFCATDRFTKVDRERIFSDEIHVRGVLKCLLRRIGGS